MPCEGVKIYRLINKVSQIFSSLAGERNRFCWQHCILETVPKPIVMNEVFGVIRWILNLKSLINANNSVQRHVKCVFFKILSHKLLTFYIWTTFSSNVFLKFMISKRSPNCNRVDWNIVKESTKCQVSSWIKISKNHKYVRVKTKIFNLNFFDFSRHSNHMN